MKKILLFVLSCILLSANFPVRAMPPAEATPPLASCKVNKVTDIYWGKSEAFPVLATVSIGDVLDVYEFDKTWALVLYTTWISQGTQGQSHSFYGYLKRSDITCDPQLEGDSSDKADTGPGKRKGKKPKPPVSTPAPGSTPVPTTVPTLEPTVPVEEPDDYDWIIRTSGVSKLSIDAGDGFVFKASFALMAQKFGGSAASSDPAYNKGLHNPYVATAAFSLVTNMSDALSKWGVADKLSGSGGVSMDFQAPSSRFYLDTASEDFALVNFSIQTTVHAVLNPEITGENVKGGGEFFNQTMPMPLDMQLKKAGGGYQFVLKNMKPGGGDLTFPAVLEKTFSDPDKWNKEAREADARRKRAEELRKELLEKIKEQTQKEYADAAKEKENSEKESTDPMCVNDPAGNPTCLAPLVPSPEPPAPEDPLAPLVPPDPLAPLVPDSGENVDTFPGGK